MTQPRRMIQACFVVVTAFFSTEANAHEFWIDPEDPSVESGDPIVANLRVGENMKGSGNIFNPNSFTFSAVITSDGKSDITGRMGDRPAIQTTAGRDGLHIVAHMTTANKLTYNKLEKFEKFARAHGQDFAIAAHQTRGLPDKGFVEAYFRCAKGLVKVGDGQGDDVTIGFPFELTALDNPYTTEGPIRMRLTYQNEAKAGHQVDVFHRASPDAEVVMMSYQTNENGEISIPRADGDFLVNAVVIEEPRPALAEKLGAVWISLWASTTYSVEYGKIGFVSTRPHQT